MRLARTGPKGSVAPKAVDVATVLAGRAMEEGDDPAFASVFEKQEKATAASYDRECVGVSCVMLFQHASVCRLLQTFSQCHAFMKRRFVFTRQKCASVEETNEAGHRYF